MSTVLRTPRGGFNRCSWQGPRSGSYCAATRNRPWPRSKLNHPRLRGLTTIPRTPCAASSSGRDPGAIRSAGRLARQTRPRRRPRPASAQRWREQSPILRPASRGSGSDLCGRTRRVHLQAKLDLAPSGAVTSLGARLCIRSLTFIDRQSVMPRSELRIRSMRTTHGLPKLASRRGIALYQDSDGAISEPSR